MKRNHTPTASNYVNKVTINNNDEYLDVDLKIRSKYSTRKVSRRCVRQKRQLVHLLLQVKFSILIDCFFDWKIGKNSASFEFRWRDKNRYCYFSICSIIFSLTHIVIVISLFALYITQYWYIYEASGRHSRAPESIYQTTRLSKDEVDYDVLESDNDDS